MKKTKVLLLSVLCMLIIVSSCKKDDDPINEADVLIKHIEASITPKTLPAYIDAQALTEAMLAGDPLVIDIRSAEKFATGHIEGAVNVPDHKLLYDYIKDNNVAKDKDIVIACYSGQSAAWSTALLKVAGYINTKSLKFGMSGWSDQAGYDYWTDFVSDDFVSQMVQTAFAKGAENDLPNLSTGFENGADILEARLEDLWAEGFGPAGTSATEVFTNKDSWYICNYWGADHYNQNHIPNAMMYDPATDPFTLGVDLKTLPSAASQTVVVYCYTGQTSAFMAAYLRLIGYNARSLKWGANSMFQETMPGTRWLGWILTHSLDYPTVPSTK